MPASAQAVKDEIERLYGSEATVELLDVFVALDQWPFYHFPEWYPAAVGLSGIPWGVGFHLSDGAGLVKTVSRIVWPYTRAALCDLLQRHPADVFVSFHPIPNYALSMSLRTMGLEVPFAIVAVDMVTTHAAWFVPGADLYCVPTPAAKARAERCNVDPDRIRVTGMPARRAFTEAMRISQSDARAALGLSPDRPAVLIVGGGEGMGPLRHVVRSLARLCASSHQAPEVVVIAGRNRTLKQDLDRMELPGSFRIEDSSATWNLDAGIGHPGHQGRPQYAGEAFIAGLPMAASAALPGQEEECHASYAMAPGFRHPSRQAARRYATGRAGETMILWRPNPEHWRAPNAAEQIARSIWSLATARPQIIAAAPQHQTLSSYGEALMETLLRDFLHHLKFERGYSPNTLAYEHDLQQFQSFVTTLDAS